MRPISLSGWCAAHLTASLRTDFARSVSGALAGLHSGGVSTSAPLAFGLWADASVQFALFETGTNASSTTALRMVHGAIVNSIRATVNADRCSQTRLG